MAKPTLDHRLYVVEVLLSSLAVTDDFIHAVQEARAGLKRNVDLLQEIMNIPIGMRQDSDGKDIAVALATIHSKAYEAWRAQRLGSGAAFPPPEPVLIEIRGGCLVNVANLPPGVEYELIDHDNDEERNAL